MLECVCVCVQGFMQDFEYWEGGTPKFGIGVEWREFIAQNNLGGSEAFWGYL